MQAAMAASASRVCAGHPQDHDLEKSFEEFPAHPGYTWTLRQLLQHLTLLAV